MDDSAAIEQQSSIAAVRHVEKAFDCRYSLGNVWCMPQISATLMVPLTCSRVYQFLKNQYQAPIYQEASRQTKGYLPQIAVLEDQENSFLRYHVPGRDVMLKISVGSWQWTYELEEAGHEETQLTITYTYSLLTDLFALGTIGHQAANDLTGTAIALAALAGVDEQALCPH